MLSIFKKLKYIIDNPCIIFVIIGLFFGSIMLFVTPPFEVPDERAHVMRACEVSNGILYNKVPAEETKYDKYFKNFFKREKENFHFASRNSAIMYIPSSLAIKIGSLFSKNSYFLFYFGRFLNLLAYIILCAFATKITPIYKYQFVYTALLPMALFMGMSYSADSYNNGFAFLFFAFIFKLIFEKKEISKKDFSVLTIFSIIGAFCKGLIYPSYLYIFIHKKQNQLPYLLILIVMSTLISFFWISINHKNLNTNFDVINNPLFMVEKPLKTIDLFVNTIKTNFIFFIKSTIGLLGVLSIYLPKYLYSQYIFIFITMFFILGEKITKKIKLISFFLFVIFYLTILYSQLIYWNNIETTIIEGFQGRYLISLIPFLFLAFPTFNLNISENFKNLFKLFIICFIITSLYISCKVMYEYYYILGIRS